MQAVELEPQKDPDIAGSSPADAMPANAMMDTVIMSIGTERFSQTLFDTMQRGLAIRQMVIHRFRAGEPVEPLALESDERDGDQLHGLVDQYVRRFHPQDPFRPELAPALERSLQVRAVSADQVRDTEYRDRLFTRPGISAKLSLLIREQDHALSISLYRDMSRGVFGEREVFWLRQSHAILAAAVQRHYALVGMRRQDDIPSIAATFGGLAAARPLSERESAVCARIVKGYSNEAIAIFATPPDRGRERPVPGDAACRLFERRRRPAVFVILGHVDVPRGKRRKHPPGKPPMYFEWHRHPFRRPPELGAVA